MNVAEVAAYQARVRELAAERHQTRTAAQIFDEIASAYHGRMQTAGVWVPWGGYVIDVVDCVSPADWTVKCGHRIVAKGGGGSPHGAWLGACNAIAADLLLDEVA